MMMECIARGLLSSLLEVMGDGCCCVEVLGSRKHFFVLGPRDVTLVFVRVRESIIIVKRF